MVNFRAELGWTTHGHSGVDVNLYAYGPMASELAGNRENTEIGEFIIDVLGLDLSAVELPSIISTRSENKRPITDSFEDRERKYHSKAIHHDL